MADAVLWRDLAQCSRADTLRELALPLPWLALALLCGSRGWTAPAVVATFVLFMTGLRVTHNAFHATLGLPAWGNHAVMYVLSVLLGGSMHAIRVTHLHHHRHCLRDDDVEGRIAHLRFGRALLHSAAYPLHIHAAALRLGTPRERGFIVAELLAVLLLQAGIWGVFDSVALQVLSLALLFANASAALIGIWAVHRACGHTAFIARSTRSALLDLLTVRMLHHLEHHLFPAVPACHLPELARRFDAVRHDAIASVGGGVCTAPRPRATGSAPPL